jgi:hypothetical protein
MGSTYINIFWKCTLLFGRVFKVVIFWGDGPNKAIHTKKINNNKIKIKIKL